MTFFFFGTLRDPDVLSLVLARRPGARETMPASLPGHRTVCARTMPYPLLVPAHGVAVDGLVLLQPSRQDEGRITWFEEDEYHAQWRRVETLQGPLQARVFFALDDRAASNIAWDYRRWREQEKIGYLQRCAEWMREFDGA